MAVGWPTKTTYANGDVYSASDVNDTNGTINLLTSSTLSVAAGKNPLINGGFDVWQRGTSFASLSGNSLYTADRWLFKRLDGTIGGTVSRQASTQTGFQYAMRVQRNNANTGTGGLYVYNTIETINSIPLAGKTITLSFYALKGANFSASNLEVYVGYGTGTDQQMGSTGFTGQATVIDTTQVLTTTSTRYTFTGTVPSNSTEVGMYLGFSPTGTAGAADYFDVSGVQIEIGSTATTFTRAGGTIQGELANCQRYYQRNTFSAGNSPSTGYGFTQTTAILDVPFVATVPMRVSPTAVDYANITAYTAANGSFTGGTVSINLSSPFFTAVRYTHGSAVFTNQVYGYLYGTSGYIGLSAEL